MRYVTAGIFVILFVHVLILHLMGQPFMYEGGYVKFWHGIVISDENSQHLFDWYSFSHVIHGLLFYLGLSVFFPKLSVGSRLILALCIESAWEIFENTDMIINRYREQALAQGYFGDSIVNSLGDMLATFIGFLAAWRLPFFGVLALIVALEALALYFIRDSLSFNIIQLIHPIDWIGNWQQSR